MTAKKSVKKQPKDFPCPKCNKKTLFLDHPGRQVKCNGCGYVISKRDYRILCKEFLNS